MSGFARHDLAFHQRHRLGECSATLGAHLMESLRALQPRYPAIHEVRGMGLMIGVELRDATGSPAAALLDTLFEEMKDTGFLLGKTGPGRNVLTLMPPLEVTSDALDTLVKCLDQAAPGKVS